MRHVCLSVVLALGGPILAQEESPRSSWKASLDEALPEAPEALVQRYLEHVQGSPLYEVARGLPAEEIQAKGKEWSEALGLEIRVETGTLVDELMDRAPGPGEPITDLFESSVYDGLWRQMEMILIHDRAGKPPEMRVTNRTPRHGRLTFGDDDGKERYFRVRGDQMKELQVETIWEVRILHPASIPVAEESVHDKPLSTVVAEICGRVGLGYALRSDDVSSAKISLSARDRTAWEILELASRVGGYNLYFEHFPPEGVDGVVTLSDVEAALIREKHLGWGEGEEIVPMEILKELVFERARSVSAARPVAILEPL